MLLLPPSLVAQRLKCLPAIQETWVRSLDWEDPLEKEMVAHSSILAWEISQTEELGSLQSMGFPRQEYWSGMPFPSPGNLPNPGVEHLSLALAGRFFTTEPSV